MKSIHVYICSLVGLILCISCSKEQSYLVEERKQNNPELYFAITVNGVQEIEYAIGLGDVIGETNVIDSVNRRVWEFQIEKLNRTDYLFNVSITNHDTALGDLLTDLGKTIKNHTYDFYEDSLQELQAYISMYYQNEYYESRLIKQQANHFFRLSDPVYVEDYGKTYRQVFCTFSAQLTNVDKTDTITVTNGTGKIAFGGI